MSDWIEVVSIAAEVTIALAAIYLGFKVHRYTQVSESMNHVSGALASINLLNATALSSDENLETIDSLYGDGRDPSLESARKRWAAFLALQTHQQIFLATESGMIPQRTAKRHHNQVLDLLIRNPEVMSLLEGRGFDPDFVRLCQERRKPESTAGETGEQAAEAHG